MTTKVHEHATLSQQAIADWLLELSSALSAGGESQMVVDGTPVPLPVDGPVRIGIEAKTEGDEHEIEIELKWSESESESS